MIREYEASALGTFPVAGETRIGARGLGPHYKQAGSEPEYRTTT